MRNERGFTLIELLVVIAIMAILFGVTALALNNIGAGARESTAKGERDVVQSAMDTYMAVNTPLEAGGEVTVTTPTTCTQVGPDTGEFGAYLRRTSEFYYDWSEEGNVLTVYDGGCSDALDLD